MVEEDISGVRNFLSYFFFFIPSTEKGRGEGERDSKQRKIQREREIANKGTFILLSRPNMLFV